MVDGSGLIGGLWRLWQCLSVSISPAGQFETGYGPANDTYGKTKPPPNSWGGVGVAAGKSGASAGRGRNAAVGSIATGWSSTSSEGSSSDTSGLAVSEIWLPQCARAVILPSVSSSSPGSRRTFFLVQNTVSR